MKWLNNLRIKQKLIVSFLMVGLLIAVVGLIGIKNISEINSNQIFMYNMDFIGIKNLSAVKANLIQINQNVDKILNEDNKSKIQSLIKEIEALRSDDDRLLDEYKNTIHHDGDIQRFDVFMDILTEYRALREGFLIAVIENRNVEALAIYEQMEKVNDRIVKCIAEYVQFKEEVAKKSYDRNLFLYEQTYVISSIITFFGVIFAVLLGIRIAATISKKIEKVLKFAEALSKGHFEHKINIDSKDEIGDLAKALNGAAVIRYEYEQELANNYEELEASHEEITALEADLREKYQELESSFEEITALEEELRDRYNEIAASEEHLRNNYEWYKMVTNASYDILWDWYIKEDRPVFSEKWHEMLGYKSMELESIRDWMQFIHIDDVQKVKETMKKHWEGREDSFAVQYRVITKDGDCLWILTTGKIIYDENGQPYRAAGCHRDITEMKSYQDRLEHMAYHDYLTDLPNRQYMYRKLEASTSDSAVIFVDIDNFKYINDTMGHTFGDSLIKVVAERMMSLVSSEDTIVRLGGDEFVLHLKSVQHRGLVEQFVKNMLLQLSKPFEVLSNSVNITASIGIALSPQDGTVMDELLKKADIAMYQSKYEGKNSYTFFVNNMNDDIIERMSIEKFMRKALINEEFVLHYQPQIEIETGKVSGFEALIRWNSPEIGFISPAKFIPIAEENHMIIDIGKWVLKTACKFIKTVHGAGREECYISVNVSILQLIQSDFTDNIYKILKETDIPPHLLELEITESVFIDSYEIIRVNIEKLKDMGVRLALDDFGKGYSSLSYLKQLPINTLKIDKSFVDDINKGKHKSLVENIIMIGHKMSLEVVAEGVELEDQASYLKEFNCDKIQGYLYSKPIPPEAAMELIKSNNF